MGKFERWLEPGFHTFNPLVYGTRPPLSLRLQSTDFAVDTITQERASVRIHVGVQYRIDEGTELQSVVVEAGEETPLKTGQGRAAKLYQACYSMSDPLVQIEQHVYQFFRSYTAMHSLNELLQSQQALSDALVEKLNAEMRPFGYIIFRCLVTDIHQPQDVMASMNSVLASQNKQQATINEAEGRKRAAILEAEGMCEVKRLEGLGMSQQRQQLAAGLHETMRSFGQDPTTLRDGTLNSILLTTNYIDMLTHAALKGNNTFILSSNPLGATAIDEQLKTSLLAAQQQCK